MLHPKILTPIAEAITLAGGKAFLVGGCVRDHFIAINHPKFFGGLVPKDFDVEVFGISSISLEQVLTPFGKVKLKGEGNFPVFELIIEGEEIFEFALARTERKVGVGHNDFSFETPMDIDIATAAARRDCTMNAILFDIISKEFLDPFGGISDIRNGIIRHTSEAFSEDPLRVLRVMQFAARFGFNVSRGTIMLCRSIVDTFSSLSMERICDIVKGEFSKLVHAPFPSMGLEFLLECKWNGHFSPLLCNVGSMGWKEVQGVVASMDAIPKILNLSKEERVGLFIAALVIPRGGFDTSKGCLLEFFGTFKNFPKNVEKISFELWDSFCKWVQPSFKGDLLQGRKIISGMKNISLELFGHFLSIVGCDEHNTFLAEVIETTPIGYFKRLITGDDLKAVGWKDGKEMGAELQRIFDIQLSNLMDRETLLKLLVSPE